MAEMDQTPTETSLPIDDQSRPQSGQPPTYWHIIVVALVAIIFTALWLGVYNVLNQVIWSSSLLTTQHWLVPIVVVAFSLLVGLTIKYLRAPTVIHGTAMVALPGPTQAALHRLTDVSFPIHTTG
jgi:hypothetical protein